MKPDAAAADAAAAAAFGGGGRGKPVAQYESMGQSKLPEINSKIP